MLIKTHVENILIDMKECIIITAYIEGSVAEILTKKKTLSDSLCRLNEQGAKNNTETVSDDYFIICADAGYDRALNEGIRPDIIMGDFDSLDGTLPQDIETFTFPSRKDYTDTGLALKYALDNGYKKVTIIGGIGGRLDHTISNIQDIVGFYAKGLDITMMDARNTFTVLGPGSYMISNDKADKENTGISSEAGDPDSYFSVFAYTENAVISETGSSYPLDHHTITNTYPLGVSNKISGNKACLTVHEGVVLFLMCH